MISKKCAHCNQDMSVRLADHNRGWGKFCSKRCKAKTQVKITGKTRSRAHVESTYDQGPFGQ